MATRNRTHPTELRVTADAGDGPPNPPDRASRTRLRTALPGRAGTLRGRHA